MLRYIIYHIFLLAAKLEQAWYWLMAKKVDITTPLTNQPFISIVILTYNADDYVKKCIQSLQNTNYQNYEVIVVDNNSNSMLKETLKEYTKIPLIHRLHLAKENNYFAKGNNIGVSLASEKSEYVVLLNSDTEIKNPDWLNILVANKPDNGIISWGSTNIPFRPDGWCFMIPKKLYQELGGLDEFYQMNWSITGMTIQALSKKYQVRTIINPDNYVKHYGKRSYQKNPNSYKFNQMKFSKVIQQFLPYHVQSMKV